MRLIDNYSKKEWQLKDYKGCEIYKVEEIEGFTKSIRYEVFDPNDGGADIYYFKTLKEVREWVRKYRARED